MQLRNGDMFQSKGGHALIKLPILIHKVNKVFHGNILFTEAELLMHFYLNNNSWARLGFASFTFMGRLEKEENHENRARLLSRCVCRL